MWSTTYSFFFPFLQLFFYILNTCPFFKNNFVYPLYLHETPCIFRGLPFCDGFPDKQNNVDGNLQPYLKVICLSSSRVNQVCEGFLWLVGAWQLKSSHVADGPESRGHPQKQCGRSMRVCVFMPSVLWIACTGLSETAGLAVMCSASVEVWIQGVCVACACEIAC